MCEFLFVLNRVQFFGITVRGRLLYFCLFDIFLFSMILDLKNAKARLLAIYHVCNTTARLPSLLCVMCATRDYVKAMLTLFQYQYNPPKTSQPEPSLRMVSDPYDFRSFVASHADSTALHVCVGFSQNAQTPVGMSSYANSNQTLCQLLVSEQNPTNKAQVPPGLKPVRALAVFFLMLCMNFCGRCCNKVAVVALQARVAAFGVKMRFVTWCKTPALLVKWRFVAKAGRQQRHVKEARERRASGSCNAEIAQFSFVDCRQWECVHPGSIQAWREQNHVKSSNLYFSLQHHRT